jgi:cytochrome P450
MTKKNTTSSYGIPVDEYKYTTFSHGIHKCPGERMAISMMEMVLAILLVRNAKLAVEKENLPSVSFERATLAQRDGNVPITIDAVTTS